MVIFRVLVDYVGPLIESVYKNEGQLQGHVWAKDKEEARRKVERWFRRRLLTLTKIIVEPEKRSMWFHD
jgi:hypothetical protein